MMVLDVAFGAVHGLFWTPCHQVDTLADRVEGPLIWEGPDCVRSAYDAGHPWHFIDQLGENSSILPTESVFLQLHRTRPCSSKSRPVHGVIWHSHRWLRSFATTNRDCSVVSAVSSSRLSSSSFSDASLLLVVAVESGKRPATHLLRGHLLPLQQS